jgi:ATP-dependent DNA helicase DinG
MAELLPSVRTVIFDEAHTLNETGVQFLGRQLSTAQVLDFCRDLLACGLQHARGLADWNQLAGAVERAARDLRLCAGRAPAGGLRLAWNGTAPERIDAASWAMALTGLQQACDAARAGLEHVSELGPDFQRLAERARALAALADFFLAERAPEAVRWLEVSQQLRLVESPLDIAAAVQSRLLAPREGEASSRAWIFTSAPRGDDERLSWFTEPCGLAQADVLRVDSPFDYAQQAAVHVPARLAKPADPQHSEQVAELAAHMAGVLGGRTLVLTTTLRALRAIGEALPQYLPPGSRLQVLIQGQLPKRELLERFRLGIEPGQPGCVLVASASFWEGVDIPGEALQLVVIDKLPFPPPGDPLVQARTRRLELTGRSPFNDYFVPEAAVALKQGAGRLIRRESDQGLLVICDIRLRQMGYGRRLLAALPPMRRLETQEALDEALLALTRISTTDPW